MQAPVVSSDTIDKPESQVPVENPSTEDFLHKPYLHLLFNDVTTATN